MSDSNDNVKFGFDCVLYISTGADTTDYIECPNVRNATTSGSFGDEDVTPRGSGGVKESEPSLEEVTVDFDILFNKRSHPDFDKLLEAKLSRGALSVLALDGERTDVGSQGPKANMKIFKWERAEDIESAVAYSVTLKPCLDSNLDWEEIEA